MLPLLIVPVVYAGPTAEALPARIEVRAGRVVRLTATVGHFRCEDFGDLGPLRVDVRPRARVGRDRAVAFTAGPPSERVTLRAVAGRRRAAGRLRVEGSIAIGQRCTSGWVRLRQPRAAAVRPARSDSRLGLGAARRALLLPGTAHAVELGPVPAHRRRPARPVGATGVGRPAD